MSRASDLLKLQKIDSQLDCRNDRMTEISLLLEDEESVRKSLARLEGALEAMGEVQIAYRLVQAESEAVENKRKASETRLYGGQVTNPKELQDLTNEVKALGRRLSTLEDQQLQAMLVQDEAEAAEELARSEYVGAESEWKSVQRSLSDEQRKLEDEIAQLEGERETDVARISVQDRQTYEMLRRSMRRVVVRLDDGVCAACGMTPSTSRVQQARAGGDLVRCGNCSRIMCVA